MKRNYFLLFFTLLFVLACGNDPVVLQGEPEDYLPTETTNQWIYDRSSPVESMVESKVEGSETVNGAEYQKLSRAYNIFGYSADTMYVRKAEDEYYLTGNLNLDIVQGLDIQFDETAFFNNDATPGLSISSIDFEQVTPPFTFNDTATSVEATINGSVQVGIDIAVRDILIAEESNGVVYDDVVSTTWNIWMASNVTLDGKLGGVSFPQIAHELVTKQQVASITQYYANHIGVIKTDYEVDLTQLSVNASIVLPVVGPIDLSTELQPILSQIQTIEERGTTTLLDYVLVED